MMYQTHFQIVLISSKLIKKNRFREIHLQKLKSPKSVFGLAMLVKTAIADKHCPNNHTSIWAAIKSMEPKVLWFFSMEMTDLTTSTWHNDGKIKGAKEGDIEWHFMCIHLFCCCFAHCGPMYNVFVILNL